MCDVLPSASGWLLCHTPCSVKAEGSLLMSRKLSGFEVLRVLGGGGVCVMWRCVYPILTFAFV